MRFSDFRRTEKSERKLARILFERDRSDLAIALLTSEEQDTFYSRMMMYGTTIPEYWTGHRSQCHPMFGAVSRYLFEYIKRENDSRFYEISGE